MAQAPPLFEISEAPAPPEISPGGGGADGNRSSKGSDRHTIVAAVDESETADAVFEYVAQNYDSPGVLVIFVYVAKPLDTLFRSYVSPVSEEEAKRHIAEGWVKKARERKVKFTAEGKVMVGDAREELDSLCHKLRPEAMVVGSHGKGLVQRMFLGSVSRYLVEHCETTVVVVKPQPHPHAQSQLQPQPQAPAAPEVAPQASPGEPAPSMKEHFNSIFAGAFGGLFKPREEGKDGNAEAQGEEAKGEEERGEKAKGEVAQEQHARQSGEAQPVGAAKVQEAEPGHPAGPSSLAAA